MEKEEGGGKRNYEYNLQRGVTETMETDWSHNSSPTREGNQPGDRSYRDWGYNVRNKGGSRNSGLGSNSPEV